MRSLPVGLEEPIGGFSGAVSPPFRQKIQGIEDPSVFVQAVPEERPFLGPVLDGRDMLAIRGIPPGLMVDIPVKKPLEAWTDGDRTCQSGAG